MQQSPELVKVKTENIYTTITEKYTAERQLLAQSDSSCIKKSLGKIVQNTHFKRTALDKFNWIFVGDKLNPEKIPFHRYVREVDNDIKKLKDIYKTATKNSGILFAAEFAQQVKKLQDELEDIRQYVRSHKEFREEDRYIQLAQRI